MAFCRVLGGRQNTILEITIHDITIIIHIFTIK